MRADIQAKTLMNKSVRFPKTHKNGTHGFRLKTDEKCALTLRNMQSLKWHKSRFFPIARVKRDEFKHTAFIGVGGNVGNVKKRFDALFRYFAASPFVYAAKTSPILQNPPFGYLKQNDFFNAVAVIQTSLSAQKLLKFLLHAEKIFGRKRSFKNAPRTLDLDIIFFDTAKFMQKNIIIPHPKWQERLSVLLPLFTV
ncbi:MAG: 2-amino-4-hydroxy-6-hydroxymethyldihydropteridine diphosphokinase [Campylobacteraceae bacterium]|jgi:2-amino-4-hydroxy-6-hydroxymethyldihydropteridine diphosphokinase|nr:2-amino-4-hydroxy-6-hydroxymethyldihydropteridine diphosphokinase [Campylobacteraceae bacterium]